MSEQIQQTSELGSTQVEMKSIIPSDWQWEVIGKDARLQKLSKDPAEMQRILDILTKNRDILTRTDNITEQGRIWSESLQGYWQMTQDGRDFASLSEKDVDGLPRTEKKAYYAWQHAELDRANVSIRDQINAKKGAMWQMIASVIPGLLLKAKNTGWKVTVEPIVREGIMMMARWELPPPEMRPQAQELIRYLA